MRFKLNPQGGIKRYLRKLRQTETFKIQSLQKAARRQKPARVVSLASQINAL